MISVRHDVSGTELSTLQVGGNCSTVIQVTTADELLQTMADSPDAFCIGGGSNLIIGDNGIATPLVRCFDVDGADVSIDADSGQVSAGAAVEWDSLVRQTVLAGLSGLECTSGVPGSTGGAVVQNLGAYGQELADVLTSVDVYDRQQNVVRTLRVEECDFAYRTSRFKHDTDRRYVVARVHLQLTVGTDNAVRYGELQRSLEESHGQLSQFPIDAIRNAVLQIRRRKGMLLGVSKPSAGSFFTNPEIPFTRFAEIEGRPGVRELIRTDTVVRISAAALMEGAGFFKGQTFGAVGLSEDHVLALVNVDHAHAADVMAAAENIQATVFKKHGVALQPEPVFLSE